MLYRLILKTRHFLYNSGIKKSHAAEVPTICVGNITVGGTGKTPHVEMILRMLMESDEWGNRNIAVLSRGYKRSSKGFQQVTSKGSAAVYGDEPLQIKKKFPAVTVAVDSDRTEGCRFLAHPELLEDKKYGKKVMNRDFPPADLIILDDAFQHRRLKADKKIVLVDYNRPIFEDRLLPFGRLRDLPERISEADVIIITKCPGELSDWEKTRFALKLRVLDFSTSTCEGKSKKGHTQTVLFTTVSYCDQEGVFSTADPRYFYSKKLMLVTGIANDGPLQSYLSDYYKIFKKLQFPDHHKFTRSDIRQIANIIKANPTASIGTTEKDAQRILDCRFVPQTIMARIFYVPIKVNFISENEKEKFAGFLAGIKRS